MSEKELLLIHLAEPTHTMGYLTSDPEPVIVQNYFCSCLGFRDADSETACTSNEKHGKPYCFVRTRPL